MADWLPPDHLVWMILDVVAVLDTTGLEGRYRLGGVGRAAYHPRMLLGVVLYAYCTGLRSARGIERACRTDVALRIACADDIPDHCTVSRFLRGCRAEVEDLFGQVLVVCARAGLGQVGVISVDGAKIEANASLGANRTQRWLREQATQMVAEALDADAAEDALFGADRRGDEPPAELACPRARPERIRRALTDLDAEQAAESAAEQARAAEYVARIRAGEPVQGPSPRGADEVAVTAARAERWARVAEAAPTAEARRDARRHQRRYQARLRELHATHPTTDQANNNQTEQNETEQNETEQNNATQGGAEPEDGQPKEPRRNTTDPDSRIMKARNGWRTCWTQAYNCQLAVTDDHLITAYHAVQDTNDLLQAIPMMTRNQASTDRIAHATGQPLRTKLYRLDSGYLSEANLTAPGPDRLIATGKARDIDRDAARTPTTGPPPPQATPIQAMRHRLRDPHTAALYRRRAATVEPVIGHLKDRLGLRRFLTRGLHAVNAELGLTATAHNLLRLHTAHP
jgi:transposase